jgi:diacylglycerol kinase (ATP)
VGDNAVMAHENNQVVNPQKARTGLSRVWHATGYSIEGLRAGWGETAFRQEAIAALVLLPLSFWLGAPGRRWRCWPARCCW